MIENPILMPPVKTRHHIDQAISLRGVLEDVKRVDGVNAKIAVFLTNIVGSMWCAYVFAIIALLGLRPALTREAKESSPGLRKRSFNWCCYPSLWSDRTCRALRAISVRNTPMTTRSKSLTASISIPKAGSRIWQIESMDSKQRSVAKTDLKIDAAPTGLCAHLASPCRRHQG